MFYGNKEIFFSKHQDGMFDTINQANFNNDGIADFLVAYSFEDGANILGLLSKNKISFIEKQIGSTMGTFSCVVLGDTSNYMCPFIVEDINHDGKDEVIINAVKMNGKVFSIACTDTIRIEP